MFKLEFGPKAFIVVSDPVVVRHLLRVRTGRARASGRTRATPRLLHLLLSRRWPPQACAPATAPR